MTLEEAICHCQEISCDGTQCGLEHKQLAEWLSELKKRRNLDSLSEGFCCKIDLTVENENKIFEEIDRYCTLCMDINCSGCQYHDIHFRNIIKNGTIH